MQELSLSPRPILILEANGNRLYGELIQSLPIRQAYWVRPLFMVEDITSKIDDLSNCYLIDLRQSPDLILPQNWFQDCYDTEIIFLLSKLYSYETLPNEARSRYYLNEFIHSICQADSEESERI